MKENSLKWHLAMMMM